MSAVDGWIKTQLGEIATLVKGISYASEDYCGAGEGAVFITIKCVSKSGGFKREGIKYFKGSIAPSQLLQPGELLIANTDLTRAGDIVGCPMVVPIMSGEIITMSMDLSKIVEDDAKIDRNFLYYKLMTDSVRHFMKDHASGSTVLHLQTRAVPNLELEIPTSKLEQTKIAEVLLTVDQAIDQTEALIAKQQHIKTGLMQDLLTRGIDEHGNLRSEQTHKFKDSPLGRIPVEWEVRTLDRLTKAIVDCPHTTPQFTQGGILVARTFNIKEGQFLGEQSYISNEEYKERILRLEPQKGDVIFTREAPVGEAFLIPVNFKVCLGQRTMLLRCVLNECLPEYLVEVIYSEDMRIRFDQKVGGTTNPHLNVGDVRSLAIKQPPIKEQLKITALLVEIRKTLNCYDQEKSKLCSIKTALMQDLLTGKKRVTPLLTEPQEAGA